MSSPLFSNMAINHWADSRGLTDRTRRISWPEYCSLLHMCLSGDYFCFHENRKRLIAQYVTYSHMW